MEELVRLHSDYSRAPLTDVRPTPQPTALPRMIEQDDPKAFLHTFEIVAGRGGWEKSESGSEVSTPSHRGTLTGLFLPSTSPPG